MSRSTVFAFARCGLLVGALSLATRAAGQRPGVASVTRMMKGRMVELTGAGRARLSKDYEWQPITFGCRWDPKKEEVTKARYTAVGR